MPALTDALRSAITPAVIESVERFASQAFTLPRIADACGVPADTLKAWISVGSADPTSLEAGVVAALRRGYVHSTSELTGVLRDAATGMGSGDEGVGKMEWRAAAFLLERVHGFVHPKDLPEERSDDGDDAWAQLELKLAEAPEAQ